MKTLLHTVWEVQISNTHFVSCFHAIAACSAVLYLKEITWVGSLFPLEERWLKILYNQVNLNSLGRQNFKGSKGSKLVLTGENKHVWAWEVLVTPEDTTGTLEDECVDPGECFRPGWGTWVGMQWLQIEVTQVMLTSKKEDNDRLGCRPLICLFIIFHCKHCACGTNAKNVLLGASCSDMAVLPFPWINDYFFLDLLCYIFV